jgi:hypothetical protein
LRKSEYTLSNSVVIWCGGTEDRRQKTEDRRQKTEDPASFGNYAVAGEEKHEDSKYQNAKIKIVVSLCDAVFMRGENFRRGFSLWRFRNIRLTGLGGWGIVREGKIES